MDNGEAQEQSKRVLSKVHKNTPKVPIGSWDSQQIKYVQLSAMESRLTAFPTAHREKTRQSCECFPNCASSLQCPTFKREADSTETPESFAAEAKFFTESRLLQRDVQIILESCPNQSILGTILHPVKTRARRFISARLYASGSHWLAVSVGVFFVSEWKHNGAPAEGRVRPLRGLVHGRLFSGS